MKLALLGTGMIVKEVLPVLAEIEGIELAAILSTPRSLTLAEDLAADYGIGLATSDYETILTSPAVDTVYVAVPNHLHYDYAKKALLAGKHVICEKPFTLKASDLADLASLAKAKNLILLEAITNQHLPNFALMKDKLAELGEIKIVNCNYSQYSSRYDAFKQGIIAPAFDPEKGGGALRDLNIYNIHLVVGLFGKPNAAHYLANQERGVDTSGLLVMDYGHFKAVCIGAKDSSAAITSTIQGDKGSLTVYGPTNSLPQLGWQLQGADEVLSSVNGDYHRMRDEFVSFEAIIREKDYDRADQLLAHSQAVMEVLDMALSEDNR